MEYRNPPSLCGIAKKHLLILEINVKQKGKVHH